MSGDMAEPFDIMLEPGNLRTRYEHAFGQGALLREDWSREGVRYVQVTSNRSWDSMHGGSTSNLANELDGTVSSLMTDLRDRGMLDSTMIVVTRIRANPQGQDNGGKDHHPNGFSAMLAGGGIKGGIAVGETDRNGGSFSRIRTQNLHATIAEH